eukprot:780579-Rhodomonas_salina.1
MHLCGQCRPSVLAATSGNNVNKNTKGNNNNTLQAAKSGSRPVREKKDNPQQSTHCQEDCKLARDLYGAASSAPPGRRFSDFYNPDSLWDE